MSLEDLFREFLCLKKRGRRKLKKLQLSRKAVAKVERKVERETHWCSYCETIGRQCRR